VLLPRISGVNGWRGHGESFGWRRRCRCGAAVVVRCSDVAHVTSTAGREFLGEGANRGPTEGHNQGVTLGAAIRDLRERAGLSQADLAAEVCKRSGRNTVSKKEVRRWELGQRNPSLYSLRFIAGALGVDVEDLLSVSRRQFVTAALVVPSAVRTVGRTGHRISLGEVTAIEEMTHTIRQLDNEFGGGHVYGIAAQCLNARVMPMIRAGGYTAPVGEELQRSATRLGHLCGWTAYDIGQHASAEKHFNTSFEISNEIGDRAFGGEILAAGSHQAIHNRDFRRAGELARSAQEIGQETGTPALLAETYILEANVWALAGDAKACGVALHKAETSLDRVTSANTPDWISYMDHGYVAARFAHCFRDLGDTVRARDYAHAALEMSGALHRTQASNTIMLASTFTESDPDQACELGSDVVDVALGLESGRVVQYVKDLQQRLTTAHPDHSAVIEFADHVRDALGA